MFEIADFKVVIEKLRINLCMINGRTLYIVDNLLQGNEKLISNNIICLCVRPHLSNN